MLRFLLEFFFNIYINSGHFGWQPNLLLLPVKELKQISRKNKNYESFQFVRKPTLYVVYLHSVKKLEESVNEVFQDPANLIDYT